VAVTAAEIAYLELDDDEGGEPRPVPKVDRGGSPRYDARDASRPIVGMTAFERNPWGLSADPGPD
jgi:hypothetical protein